MVTSTNTGCQVIKRDVLNFASIGNNSNKFYIMELRDYGYMYQVYANYGRLGASGQVNRKEFSSAYQAEAEYNKRYREKTGKGYCKVEMEGEVPTGATRQTVHTPTKERELAKIQDKVLKFIGRLYTHATEFTTKSVQTPLGAISSNQVTKGYQILSEIEHAIRTGKGNTLVLSDQFYSLIPVQFGRKVDADSMHLDEIWKIDEKKDLLDVMESVVVAQDSLEKTLEEKYASLKIDLKALSSRTKDYKRLKEWVEKSQSRHHHFRMDVTGVFKVNDMVGHDKFNPYNVSTMELFHGSRNENILSILQGGLKIKPRGAQHSGSMFGDSLYFASESSKSGNYCWGFNNRNVQDKHYLFVAEVATGRIKEYTDAQPGLKKAPRGYNSVLGKKGPNLLHDEYMVYSETQSKIRYIIEFEKC